MRGRAEEMNGAAEIAEAFGLTLGYHDHPQEFIVAGEPLAAEEPLHSAGPHGPPAQSGDGRTVADRSDPSARRL